MAGIADPLTAMHERGKAYVRFGIDHPEHYRIMFMGPAYTTPDQWADLLATGSFAHLVESLTEAVDAGLLGRSAIRSRPRCTSGPTSTG